MKEQEAYKTVFQECSQRENEIDYNTRCKSLRVAVKELHIVTHKKLKGNRRPELSGSKVDHRIGSKLSRRRQHLPEDTVRKVRT